MNIKERLTVQVQEQTVALIKLCSTDPASFVDGEFDQFVCEAHERREDLLELLEAKQFQLVYECLDAYTEYGRCESVSDGRRVRYMTADEIDLPY